MKALITLIATSLLATLSFANSPYAPNVETAEGRAIVQNHAGENFAIVKLNGNAAKMLYFAMQIAPTESRHHLTNLPIESKQIESTTCDREMQQDRTVNYQCSLIPNLEKRLQ